MSDTERADATKTKPDPNEEYGYYFYPERGGVEEKKKPWSSYARPLLFSSNKRSDHLRCTANVHSCMQTNPLVKLLVGALKSQGCPVELGRHISCEPCTSRVNGGFDPAAQQVVVCENNSKGKLACCSVLTHELTHMFDYCRAKVDFTNLEHLACTEIRAANFMHCSFLNAFLEGDATPFNVRERQKECVKRKALMSVLMVRNISLEEGKTVVDKVFDKCYKDREPLGRIPRRNSSDPDKIYAEGYLYGYTDNFT